MIQFDRSRWSYARGAIGFYFGFVWLGSKETKLTQERKKENKSERPKKNTDENEERSVRITQIYKRTHAAPDPVRMLLNRLWIPILSAMMVIKYIYMDCISTKRIRHHLWMLFHTRDLLLLLFTKYSRTTDSQILCSTIYSWYGKQCKFVNCNFC